MLAYSVRLPQRATRPRLCTTYLSSISRQASGINKKCESAISAKTAEVQEALTFHLGLLVIPGAPIARLWLFCTFCTHTYTDPELLFQPLLAAFMADS